MPPFCVTIFFAVQGLCPYRWLPFADPQLRPSCGWGGSLSRWGGGASGGLEGKRRCRGFPWWICPHHFVEISVNFIGRTKLIRYMFIYICIHINISRLSRNYVLDDAMQGEWLMNGFILFPFPDIGTFWNLSYPESIRQLFSGRRIRAHHDILHNETMARRGNFIRSGPYFFLSFFTMNHPIFGGNDLSSSHDSRHGHMLSRHDLELGVSLFPQWGASWSY